jgi:cation transport regulator ChaB
MPYDANPELPKSVRDHLPEHAQTIYREAFNHAWLQYAQDRRMRRSHIGSLERRETEVSQSRRALGPEGLTMTAGDDGLG